MLMMVDPYVHFQVITRYASERMHLGSSFPDAGLPGSLAPGKAVKPEAAVQDVMLLRLRTAWGATGA